MAQPGIRWVRKPDVLAANLERYGERVITAITAVAGYIATQMANSAKHQAPWTDRSGNARSGIFGASERDAAQGLVIIYLSHGPAIDYGVYLELAHGSRFAIIMRTIEAHLPEIHRMLNEIFQG